MSLAQRISRSIDEAFRALDDLAGPMTLVSQSADPTYTPSNGSVTKNESSFTVTAVFDNYESDRVDGTVVQREDRKILVKPQEGLVPKVGDTITDAAGVVYNIMDVESVTAYNQVFLWELQARK